MKQLERYHPETRVGGYSAVDGTVEFYLRLSTLLAPGQVILDLGAGRGAWTDDQSMAPMKRQLLDLRGDGRRLVGCDVDPVVKQNPTLDEAAILDSDSSPLPFADRSFDIVVSDWTFEHLSNPAYMAQEIARVVRTGGWLCARTPNRNGYISMANRLIPSSLHSRILRRGQPGRKAEDVFPTCYRVNTSAQVKAYFGTDFRVTTYMTNPEPAYCADSRGGWAAFKAVERLLPRRFGAVMLIFAQRV